MSTDCQRCQDIPDYEYFSGFDASARTIVDHGLVRRDGKLPDFGFDQETILRCPLCGQAFLLVCEVGFGQWDIELKRLRD